MGDGTFAETGRLPGRDVCRDGTFAGTGTFAGISPCMYISHIFHVSFIWKECFLGRFSSHPGKVGSRQSGTIFMM